MQDDGGQREDGVRGVEPSPVPHRSPPRAPPLPSPASRRVSQAPIAETRPSRGHATFVYSPSEFQSPGALYKPQQASRWTPSSPSSSPPLSTPPRPLNSPITSTNGTHTLFATNMRRVLTKHRQSGKGKAYALQLGNSTRHILIYPSIVASPPLARLAVRLASLSRVPPRPVSSSRSVVSTVC